MGCLENPPEIVQVSISGPDRSSSADAVTGNTCSVMSVLTLHSPSAMCNKQSGYYVLKHPHTSLLKCKRCQFSFEWAGIFMSLTEWMKENLYTAHKKQKTSAQNLACSQRQIHPVHTWKLSQAKRYQRTPIPKNTNIHYHPPLPKSATIHIS